MSIRKGYKTGSVHFLLRRACFSLNFLWLQKRIRCIFRTKTAYFRCIFCNSVLY